VKIAPSILTLSFDRTLEKAVPVRPRLVGTPAAGFEVTAVTSTPASVRIDGPRSRVEGVETAFTEAVGVDGATGPVNATVSVGLPDPLLRLIGNPLVQVAVRVAEASQKRAFDGLLVDVRGGAALARPAHVRVVVAGTAAALESLTEASLRPYVILVPGPPGEPQRARVSLDLPPGLSVAAIDPEELILRPSNKRNAPP
jgi:YbbR-like protein